MSTRQPYLTVWDWELESIEITVFNMESISMDSFQPARPSCDVELLFQKTLLETDIDNTHCTLIIPEDVQQRIFNFLTPDQKRQVMLHHKGALFPIFDCEEGRVWPFRFKYGRSSEPYVFEREWINFLRLKALKTGDIVKFWGDNTNRRFLITYLLL